VKDLEAEMKEAADNLDFERAADLRDQIISLKGLRKNKKRSNYIKSL
jgi:excinuclease ABC subunit B